MKQILTFPCSTEAILRHPHFARGLADARAGRPFDDRIQDAYWAYERGRQFGAIAPRSLALFIGGRKLNPRAVALVDAAFERGHIV
jgi:hypothetical protein